MLLRSEEHRPSDEAKTTPKPTASGPPMFRNFSLGAHMATVERPPTMPAVYHAARIIRGPPSRVRGAMIAPITPKHTHSNSIHLQFIFYYIESIIITIKNIIKLNYCNIKNLAENLKTNSVNYKKNMFKVLQVEISEIYKIQKKKESR